MKTVIFLPRPCLFTVAVTVAPSTVGAPTLTESPPTNNTLSNVNESPSLTSNFSTKISSTIASYHYLYSMSIYYIGFLKNLKNIGIKIINKIIFNISVGIIRSNIKFSKSNST